MPTTERKTANSNTRSRPNGNKRTKSSSAPGKQQTARSGAAKSQAGQAKPESLIEKAESDASALVNEARTNRLAQSAFAAVAGTAIAAFAGRALLKRRSPRKRVLAVPLPNKMIDMHVVADQIGNLAGRLEKVGSGLTEASGPAQRVARVLTDR
jgi:hypothetical protein